MTPASGPSSDDPSAPPSGADDGQALTATVYLAIGLPEGTIPGRLSEVQIALADAVRHMTEAGHPVRYLNGMYMPAHTRLLCVFAAESEEVVYATVEQVRLPFERINAITDAITDDWDRDRDPGD